MSTIFHDFSVTYREFNDKFPEHPLAEEIRRSIGRGRFPDDEWLRAKTQSMKDLLAPIWLKAG